MKRNLSSPPPPTTSTRTLEVYVSPDCPMRRLHCLQDTITAVLAEGVTSYGRMQATVITKDGAEEVYKRFSVVIRADVDVKELLETLRRNEEVRQAAIVQKEDQGEDEPDYIARECSIQ